MKTSNSIRQRSKDRIMKQLGAGGGDSHSNDPALRGNGRTQFFGVTERAPYASGCSK
jgi:hypothetical protein